MKSFLKETKICVVCQRPFTWRKKWAQVWDAVQYCSKSCRSNRNNRKYRLKYE
ncbi:MAG: DUF2256 domain-containing protein [Puniceicoccaceae bacterium]|nr:MAG: DUF2256 domain-containing protein [Puniceicoccaceae bacterium]